MNQDKPKTDVMAEGEQMSNEDVMGRKQKADMDVMADESEDKAAGMGQDTMRR
jgi:hypothetical protein